LAIILAQEEKANQTARDLARKEMGLDVQPSS
jgi:hypothetical protein